MLRKRLWSTAFGLLLMIPAAACHSGAQAGSATSPSAPAVPILTSAPESGASLAAVTAWIKAGTPTDPATFAGAYPMPDPAGGSVTRTVGVAFTSPDRTITCVGLLGLQCGVPLQHPPPPPLDHSDLPWHDNLVEAVNGRLDVGAYRPTPAIWEKVQSATPLPDGSTLTSAAGLTCRTDPAGVYCLSADTKSAYRISPAGVLTFGCLLPLSGRQSWSCPTK